MAEAIANKSPMIEVPGALRSLFTRAIKARQKAAEWFTASHSDTILDESNQTRAHFVDILQRAGHVLEPLVKERPTQAPKPKQPPEKSKLASMQQITNAFSSLAVESETTPDDPEEESGEAAQPEEPLESLPPVRSVEIQQDESEIDPEFFFAIQSFIMIYGGAVCLNRLLKEDANFVNYLRGSEGRNVIIMYMPWAGETFFKTRIYRLLELYIEDAEAEIRRLTRENMRIWIESEQRYYRLTNDPENPLEPDDDALDPCADCPRCKRRKFLGHRYPGHYNPHMTYDHDGHDHDGHEHQHNGENGHSHTEL
jgi:hypothetical protein